MNSNKDNIDILINHLNQVRNKEQTLTEFLDELNDNKIICALTSIEKKIKQEINQNKLLLISLTKHRYILDKMNI